MVKLAERLKAFSTNRWLVLVAAMWLQSMAGIGYLFGAISPVVKSSLGYNQRQVAALGVAKDLGDCVGFLAGTLSSVLPVWAMLLIGSAQNLVGYGWLWLIVTGRSPVLPLWTMCILIFVGTNGETFFNTASLVSCIQNFPRSRGPVVGLMKGFAGLSSAILTQLYTVRRTPDHASLILMAAAGPSVVAVGLMFVIRPVGGHRQARPSDEASFTFIYVVCLLIASYLVGVMLVQELMELDTKVVVFFTVILFLLLLIALAIPVILAFCSDSDVPTEESLLPGPSETFRDNEEQSEAILSEAEDEKPEGIDPVPPAERRRRIAELQAKVVQAAARWSARIKRGPRRGEDFTLMQALVKPDFWLIWFALLLGSGSGLTVIDNLGQMSQAVGFRDSHIFVSLISIWNFLGRVGGGYLSEMIARERAYPRHIALAAAQVLMAIGHVLFAMAWPGTMHAGTFLVGLGYGAHWGIVPAAVSELFGLRHFGAMYNFLTVANPAASLVLSGLIASHLYDYEAEKQAHRARIWISGPGVPADAPLKCEGAVCFFVSSLIMSALCVVGACLSLVVVHRTKRVYAHIYGAFVA